MKSEKLKIKEEAFLLEFCVICHLDHFLQCPASGGDARVPGNDFTKSIIEIWRDKDSFFFKIYM